MQLSYIWKLRPLVQFIWALLSSQDITLNHLSCVCVLSGGGGALLREKMVEVVSDKFICIVDESKLSKVGTSSCCTVSNILM